MTPRPRPDWEQGADQEKVTIGVVTHNRKEILQRTLEAIDRLDYPAYDVMVVDNQSTDGSWEWVRQAYPHYRTIQLEKNLGPNVARNLILTEGDSRYVLLMDNDIALEPNALAELMDVMQRVPRAAVCHAEIRDPLDPEAALHYNGGWIHYLGALMPRRYASATRPRYELFDVLSGQVLLIDRQAAAEIGGFDDYYFFGWTDGDFTVRMSLAGYLCLNVPYAVGWHNTAPRSNPKVFYQVRNRWYFMLKTYAWRTLLLAAPALLVYEAALLGLLLFKGGLKGYFSGNLAVLRDLRQTMSARRRVQQLKRTADRDWLRGDDLFVPATLTKRGKLRWLVKIYNGFFRTYWNLIRPLCG